MWRIFWQTLRHELHFYILQKKGKQKEGKKENTELELALLTPPPQAPSKPPPQPRVLHCSPAP